MSTMCPYCEADGLELVRYTDRLKMGRKVVEVTGLSKMVCSECGSECVPLELFAMNAPLIERAASATSAAVSPGALRKFRECWGLSQRDASRMFGAGASAFAKWESGQSELSTPSALLIQCAFKFPDVVGYLARLATVSLQTQECLPFHESTLADGWRPISSMVDKAVASSPVMRIYRSGIPVATNEASEASNLPSGQGWRQSIAATVVTDGTYLPMAEAA